jgi:hypothetical protein
VEATTRKESVDAGSEAGQCNLGCTGICGVGTAIRAPSAGSDVWRDASPASVEVECS